MYLNKYDIKGETYVKLDELNDLLKSERKAIAQKMKQRHAEGEDNTGWAVAHSQLIDFARKVNMSEGGEKYIIFRRDDAGEWEYFMELVKWDNIPDFVKRHMEKGDDDYALVGTNQIEEATLFNCFEDAQDALAEIEAECPKQVGKWHAVKRWQFDTDESREAMKRLCGGDEKPDKKAAIKQAEDAIERTKASKRCPGRYTVWYRDDSDTTAHCMGFVKFEGGYPLFTNHPCRATWFVWRGVAEKIAERCGKGFEVVDMIGQMTAEERLLRAIFREDGMDGDEEPEYHGDGTRAEDEDWDGDD